MSGVSRVTNHVAILDCTKRQSVGSHVGSAEDDATLPPKALCVDDSASLLSRHHIKPTGAVKGHHWSILESANTPMSNLFTYPSPSSSMLGGRTEFSHTT